MVGETDFGRIADGLNRIADRLESFIKVADSGQQFPQPSPRFTDSQNTRVESAIKGAVWALQPLNLQIKLSEDQIEYILQLLETRLREANEKTHG